MLNIKEFQKVFIPTTIESPIHRIHPITKIIGIIATYITITITTDIKILATLLLFLIVENIVGRATKQFIALLKGGKLPILFLIMMILIFNPPKLAIAYILRFFVGGIAILNFIATTRHSDLAQALEKLKVPHSIIQTIELTLRLIPLAMKDATQTIDALTLRFKKVGIIETLSVIIATSLSRSSRIGEALIAKYYGAKKKRTYTEKLTVTPQGLTLTIIKIIIMLIALKIQYVLDIFSLISI